jgi:hypothetical protein
VSWLLSIRADGLLLDGLKIRRFNRGVTRKKGSVRRVSVVVIFAFGRTDYWMDRRSDVLTVG